MKTPTAQERFKSILESVDAAAKFARLDEKETTMVRTATVSGINDFIYHLTQVARSGGDCGEFIAESHRLTEQHVAEAAIQALTKMMEPRPNPAAN